MLPERSRSPRRGKGSKKNKVGIGRFICSHGSLQIRKWYELFALLTFNFRAVSNNRLVIREPIAVDVDVPDRTPSGERSSGTNLLMTAPSSMGQISTSPWQRSILGGEVCTSLSLLLPRAWRLIR